MSETEIVQDYSPNFEAWISDFQEWQTRIGFDPSWLGDYRFDIKFDWDTAGSRIEFGDFEGMPKWQRRMQIPQQNIRDAIISMVSVQGDTEFASVEQQNHLLDTAPTEYDKKSALRIMCEEQRHGWQMAYLLCTYFAIRLGYMSHNRERSCKKSCLGSLTQHGAVSQRRSVETSIEIMAKCRTDYRTQRASDHKSECST